MTITETQERAQQAVDAIALDLIRPLLDYTGPRHLRYVPIDQREREAVAFAS